MSLNNIEKLELSPEAVRVLGVLIEKEKTTPDSYPLTLNTAVLGCNQSTNRSPVVDYDEMVVERALSELREKGLALRGVYAGSRVPKHRHNLSDAMTLSEGAISVLAVLLLRGPQTLGEIKQRTERMYKFESLADCDQAIEELENYSPSLATRHERVPGQKESRISHKVAAATVLSAVDNNTDEDISTRPSLQLIEGEKTENGFSGDDDELDFDEEVIERIDILEKEVTVLTHEIMSLRAEIDALRDPSA